jgi:hypothetical protein
MPVTEAHVIEGAEHYFARGYRLTLYPVRNNAPLLPPGQRPSGLAAATGLGFRIIPPACPALGRDRGR